MAQDSAEVTLGYDSPVTGTIDDSQARQIWPLEVTSTDRISIRVERTGGNLLPDVILRDPNGDNVNQSYGPDNTGAVAEIDNVDLEKAGTYQILVQRVDFEDGVTSGDYSLTVTLLASGEDSEANTSVISPIEYNTYIEGRITPDHWLHRYSISAPAADYLQVTGRRNAGTLMPEVEIRDSEDNSLRIGYVEDTGDYATFTYELPQAGDYTIIMTRDRRYDGETSGTYRLTLDLLGAGEDSPVLDTIAGEIEYGTPVVSALEDGQWYQDWTLNVDAGDVISITEARPLDASADAGNLRPEVVLMGGSGQELRHGYIENDGAEAIIDHYQLEAPGQYIIRAMRERGKTGSTTGSYALTVTLDGAGPGSPGLTEASGTVELDTPAEGEISGEHWMNVWNFDATADQQIDIHVERTSGTLIPMIDIQDANGQSLRMAYPENSDDWAEITNYRFPTTGTYHIVVKRQNDESGYTTGSYQLSVSLTPQQ